MFSSEAPDLDALAGPLVVPLGTLVANKYRIVELIAHGGMGSVYEATQIAIGRSVAIKLLPRDLTPGGVAQKRFEREARIIARLQHPHIVTVHDFGITDDGLAYLVMERLSGTTLKRALDVEGAFAPSRAVSIVRQTCRALAEAHAAHVVHRDLKPSNLQLTQVRHEEDWVKVLDFGVAKLVEPDVSAGLTGRGTVGTPRYMAPEQASASEVDARADIYALGTVLFEMLSGRPPFVDPQYGALLYKHMNQPPPFLREVRPDLAIDGGLEAIMRKALEKRPEDRFASADELDRALGAWVDRTPLITPIIVPELQARDALVTRTITQSDDRRPSRAPRTRATPLVAGVLGLGLAFALATALIPDSTRSVPSPVPVPQQDVREGSAASEPEVPAPAGPEKREPQTVLAQAAAKPAAEAVLAQHETRVPETRVPDKSSANARPAIASAPGASPAGASPPPARAASSFGLRDVSIVSGDLTPSGVERALSRHRNAFARCSDPSRRTAMRLTIIASPTGETASIRPKDQSTDAYLACLRRTIGPSFLDTKISTGVAVVTAELGTLKEHTTR